MKAEDVWSDFDCIIDLDSICNVGIDERVALVKRVACACCLQVIDSLHELRDPLNDEYVFQQIEKKYNFWRKLHDNLIKL